MVYVKKFDGSSRPPPPPHKRLDSPGPTESAPGQDETYRVCSNSGQLNEFNRNNLNKSFIS
jgi:hypothetical protein